MKTKLYIIGFIFLSGCATTANYQEAMESWLGKSEEELVTKWGAPQSVYTLSNNKKILSYIEDLGGSARTNVSYGTAYTTYSQHTCKTDFVLDTSGQIESFKFEGNSCKSFPVESAKQDSKIRPGKDDPDRIPIFCKYFKIGCEPREPASTN